MKKPEAEDSLENTFSCVPKVQGIGRISQANGQSMRIYCAVFICAVLFEGCFFVATTMKEGKNYVCKTFGFYRIRIFI